MSEPRRDFVLTNKQKARFSLIPSFLQREKSTQRSWSPTPSSSSHHSEDSIHSRDTDEEQPFLRKRRGQSGQQQSEEKEHLRALESRRRSPTLVSGDTQEFELDDYALGKPTHALPLSMKLALCNASQDDPMASLLTLLHFTHLSNPEHEVKTNEAHCELILSHLDPRIQLPLIHQHMTGGFAYIRFENKLFYYNKMTRVLSAGVEETDARVLHLFDLRFGLRTLRKADSSWPAHLAFTKPRPLSQNQLIRIRSQWGIGPAIRTPSETISPWRKNKGVDLIDLDFYLRGEHPSTVDFDRLPFSNAAYLRYQGELWYVRRLKGFQKFLSRFGLVKERELVLTKTDDQSLIDKGLPRMDVDTPLIDVDHDNPEVGDPETFDPAILPTEAAYLRHKGKLWYVRRRLNPFQKFLSFFGLVKQRRVIVNNLSMERFDEVFYDRKLQGRKFYQHLSDEDIELVSLLTGHTHRTAWQKFLHYFGNFCVGFIALGCGISTAATFIGLNIVTGGLATVIAALFFFAGAAVNWWIFKRYVSPVLIALFGQEKFFVDEKGKPLSIEKKIAMVIAVLLSLSVGITFAGLTYVSTLALPMTFAFLGAVSFALPPVAALLAAVTLICMTALMLKDIAALIKKENIRTEIKNYFVSLFCRTLPRDAGKSTARVAIERTTSVLLTAVLVPLAIVGLFMTMNACLPGVKTILMSWIPSLSEGAALGIATFVSLVPAFIGQIPFGVQTVCQTIDKIVSGISNGLAKLYQKVTGAHKASSEEPAPRGSTVEPGEAAAQPDSIGVKVIKVFSAITNGVGNGVIAMAGAVGAFWSWIALGSGTENSFCAGIPAVLSSKKLPEFKGPEKLFAEKTQAVLGQSPAIPVAIPEQKTSAVSEEFFIPKRGSQDAEYVPPQNAAAHLSRADRRYVEQVKSTAETLQRLKKKELEAGCSTSPSSSPSHTHESETRPLLSQTSPSAVPTTGHRLFNPGESKLDSRQSRKVSMPKSFDDTGVRYGS